MTKGDNFIKNAKCKHWHRSPMKDGALCDINKNVLFLCYMIYATVQNVIVKSNSLLFLNNFNFQVDR